MKTKLLTQLIIFAGCTLFVFSSCKGNDPSMKPTSDDSTPGGQTNLSINKLWNFSDDVFTALDTIKSTVTIDGLTITATKTKPVVIAANSEKKLDDLSFTSSLKLSGIGKDTCRNVSFHVNGPSRIDIYLVSATSSEERTLLVDCGAVGGTNIGEVTASTYTKGTVEYSGKGDDIYIYSKEKPLNLYAIRVSPLVHSIVFKDSGDAGDATSTGDGSKSVTEDEDVIESASIEVASTSCSKVTFARTGCGLKLGVLNQDKTAFIAGSLTINLAQPMAVSKLLFGVAGYKEEENTMIVQGQTADELSVRCFSQYVVDMNDKELSTITVQSSETIGRGYIHDITIVPAGVPMPEMYVVTATSEDAKKGEISGHGQFVWGTRVDLVARPKTGYRFDHWSDGNKDNPRSFNVWSDVTYTAYFEVE